MWVVEVEGHCYWFETRAKALSCYKRMWSARLPVWVRKGKKTVEGIRPHQHSERKKEMTITVYSIDVASNGDQEQVTSERLFDEDGNQIDIRRHAPEFDLGEAVFSIQECTIPYEVGSLDHIRLTHVGIEVNDEHYDLEVVPS